MHGIRPIYSALLLASFTTSAASWGNGCPAGETNYFSCSQPKVVALCGEPGGAGLHLVLNGLNLGRGSDFFLRHISGEQRERYQLSFTSHGSHYLLFDDYRKTPLPPSDVQGLVVTNPDGVQRRLHCHQGYNKLEALAGKLDEPPTEPQQAL